MAGDGFTRTGAVDKGLEQVITGVLERTGDAINLRETLKQMGVQILEALPQGLTPAGRSVH
jgi:hypothetical protein